MGLLEPGERGPGLMPPQTRLHETDADLPSVNLLETQDGGDPVGTEASPFPSPLVRSAWSKRQPASTTPEGEIAASAPVAGTPRTRKPLFRGAPPATPTVRVIRGQISPLVDFTHEQPPVIPPSPSKEHQAPAGITAPAEKKPRVIVITDPSYYGADTVKPENADADTGTGEEEDFLGGLSPFKEIPDQPRLGIIKAIKENKRDKLERQATEQQAIAPSVPAKANRPAKTKKSNTPITKLPVLIDESRVPGSKPRRASKQQAVKVAKPAKVKQLVQPKPVKSKRTPPITKLPKLIDEPRTNARKQPAAARTAVPLRERWDKWDQQAYRVVSPAVLPLLDLKSRAPSKERLKAAARSVIGALAVSGAAQYPPVLPTYEATSAASPAVPKQPHNYLQSLREGAQDAYLRVGLAKFNFSPRKMLYNEQGSPRAGFLGGVATSVFAVGALYAASKGHAVHHVQHLQEANVQPQAPTPTPEQNAAASVALQHLLLGAQHVIANTVDHASHAATNHHGVHSAHHPHGLNHHPMTLTLDRPGDSIEREVGNALQKRGYDHSGSAVYQVTKEVIRNKHLTWQQTHLLHQHFHFQLTHRMFDTVTKLKTKHAA